MLLIFFSWIYIFFTAANFGILFTSLFRIKNCNVFILQVLGLFLYTIVTNFFAFFIRINIEYYFLILALNIIITYRYSVSLKQYFYFSWQSFKTLKLQYKALYLVLFFVILAQSSTNPYLLDNETYYIQTIKWINEYGFVKGLANIHMFFGQSSSWHVLQAGFNFSFITDFYNDINGYLFSLFGFLAIKKLNNYSPYTNNQGFNFGLMLLFTLFLMQFVNAPSPDLIIFLTTPYIFYLFIANYKKLIISNLKILFSLVVFLCFVKVTIAVLLLLPLILVIKHFEIAKKEIWQYALLAITAFGLFVAKNAVVSGYYLYPISQIDIAGFDWKVPKNILEFYKLGTYLEGMSNIDVSQLGFLEKVKLWLTLPKLDGLFNKAFATLLLIFPWFILKNKHATSLLILYVVAVLQLIILWFTSPQYRFFFVFVSFLAIQLFTIVIKNKKIGVYCVAFSIVLSAIPVFASISLNTLTDNNFAMELSSFKLNNSIIPQGNTKTKTNFTKHDIDGFEFYSPDENAYFWVSGNGQLPCVNKKQILFIRHQYGYVPKLRTGSLKDGFQSVLVKEQP